MRQSRFTETEIVYAVKQLELGIPVREIAREYGVRDKHERLELAQQSKAFVA